MLMPPGQLSIEGIRNTAVRTSVDRVGAFDLPSALNADRPAERRGMARDRVRLLVLSRKTAKISHARFDRITEFLGPGDLLVFNSSRTLPATLLGTVKGSQLKIETRLAELLPGGIWLALLLPQSAENTENVAGKTSVLDFGAGLNCEVLEQDQRIPRLWKLRFSTSGPEFLDLLYRVGEPVRYKYLAAPWRLSYYQNVYALQPGAAEMASAGRPFTWRLLLQLRNQGIESSSITLHTGLSSYLDNEIDHHRQVVSEEAYWISEEAAAKIRRAKNSGRRIVAIGTTVVRALESIAAESGGDVIACHRYTQLRITAGYRLQIVSGLLTGLHEPEASHLDLLTAFVPPPTLYAAYSEAIRQRYLWHEFGDLNLIL